MTETGTPEAAPSASQGGASGNGSHEGAAPPADREPREPPEPREARETREPATQEFHAQARESGASQEPAPIAHFEPAQKSEGGDAPGKPYVVWSSTPSQRDAGSRGSEE